MLNIFQNSNFYFFRKPNGIPSTFGKEKSFLDYVFLDNIKLPKNLIFQLDLDFDLLEQIKKQIFFLNLEIIKKQADKFEIIKKLMQIFTKNQEFGLLNRLDNDTGGLLYFAKNTEIYNNYKTKQKQDLITKFYIAQVRGNPFFKTNSKEIIIDYPIMHHKFDKDRMICISKPGDEVKGNGKQHLVLTKVSLLNFNQEKNISTLLISISKGIRHQIRIHLSSIGCPIIGEKLYYNQEYNDFLHLFSVGFDSKSLFKT